MSQSRSSALEDRAAVRAVRVRDWDARHLAAAAAGATLVRKPAADAHPSGAPGPQGASIDSRAVSAWRPVRGAARPTLRRRRPCRAGAGRRGVGRPGRRDHAHAPRPALTAARCSPTATRSRPCRHSRGCGGASCGRAERCRRDHRLDWQDIDEGYPCGTARLPSAGDGDPRELQHGDRPAARAAGRPSATRSCWCSSWRCAVLARSPS